MAGSASRRNLDFSSPDAKRRVGLAKRTVLKSDIGLDEFLPEGIFPQEWISELSYPHWASARALGMIIHHQLNFQLPFEDISQRASVRHGSVCLEVHRV